MIGVILALCAAFSTGFEKILHRYILAREDTVSYVFTWHFLSALFFLPLFLISFKLPSTPYAWAIVALSGLLWTAIGYVGFKAYSLLEISEQAPIARTRLFFVLFLSALFLREALTTYKVIGTLLIFAGIAVLTFNRPGKKFQFTSKGVIFTLFAALMMSVALLVDKYAMNFFAPSMYTFMVYAIPATLFLPAVLRRKKEYHSIIKNRPAALIGTVVLGSAYYFLLLNAFKLTEASIAIPLTEIGTLIAVLGGIIFLKEREHLTRKLIASAIVIAGAILLSVGGA